MGPHRPLLPGLIGLGMVLLANPAYGQSITASPDGTQTQVNQTGNDYSITGGTRAGDNLFHSFGEFNLLNGESATFLADPGTLNVLGRVNGGSPSVIDGLLSVSGSNANLFLLNPAGVLFGPNSALNLGGSFTATTADGVTFGTGDFGAIGSNDYGTLVGDPTGFTFNSDTPGSIVNGGNLAVSPGETLQLIGGQVINTGTLTAPDGTIIIAAVEGENLVRIAQDGLVLNLELATLPDNSGAPLPFTPLALPELLTGSGLSDAIAVTVNPDGTVSLTGSDVPITAQPGIAVASGDLQAAGGQVDILGSTVALIDALVDTSGEFGGGQIRVGGDYLGSGPVPNAQVTYVDENSVLQADATVNGDGGRIILWSDQTTRTYGNLSARGGLLDGDGGFIETSSAGYLDILNAPDVSAPNGNGGSWLIDPHNITIGGALSGTFSTTTTSGASLLTATSDDVVLSTALVESFFLSPGFVSLTISTGNTGTQAGNITIADNLTFAAAGTFILDAAGDVNLTHSIDAGGAALNITINAGGNIIFDNTSAAGLLTAFDIETDGGDINFTANGITIGGASGTPDRTIDAGTGSINLTANGSGILVETTGVLTTTSGSINLNGTSIGGDGIEVLGDVTTTNGTINLTGSGAIDGVKLAGGEVSADGGTVNINGTGGTGFGAEVQAFSSFGTDPLNLNIQGTSSTGTSINSAVDFDTFGGNLSLTGNQDIVATNLTAAGGAIDVTTDTFFRASGGVTTTGGSAITIRHGGAGITPFIVGDATTNGTGGAISNVADTIAITQSFLLTYIQGNISIISVTTEGDCINTSDTFCEKLPGSDQLPEALEPDEILTAEPETVTDYELTTLDIEESVTEDFASHFGFDTPTIASPEVIQQNLKDISDATGAQPGVLYVYFAPQAVETVPQISQLPQTQTKGLETEPVLWSSTHEGLTVEALPWQQARRPENVPPRASDPLELILVTPEAAPIRLRLPEVRRDQFMALARTFRNEVADPSKVRTTSYLASSQQLYDWLLRPLEAELAVQNINNISFILDAGLRGTPLAALHDGNGFIIERFSIGLMPSFSLTDTRYRDVRDVTLLAAGAAEFQAQAPLPAVPIELNTIVDSIWPGSLLLNETFTPEQVRAERDQRPFGIIHLATHGEFRTGAPANSYIQFWQERVQLDDIRQMGWADPVVELVVLSACRLAVGDEQAELGFAGMAVQAGVKSVLASLWNVDDTGTMGLMLEFYQQLQDAPIKAEAIRQAQLQMLNRQVSLSQGTVTWSGGTVDLPSEFGAGTKRFNHPYFWSAFTMVGNPW